MSDSPRAEELDSIFKGVFGYDGVQEDDLALLGLLEGHIHHNSLHSLNDELADNSPTGKKKDTKEDKRLREQNRRLKITKCIGILKGLVPNCASNADQSTVLCQTVAHIQNLGKQMQQLQNQNTTHAAEIQNLRTLCQQLLQQQQNRNVPQPSSYQIPNYPNYGEKFSFQPPTVQEQSQSYKSSPFSNFGVFPERQQNPSSVAMIPTNYAFNSTSSMEEKVNEKIQFPRESNNTLDSILRKIKENYSSPTRAGQWPALPTDLPIPKGPNKHPAEAPNLMNSFESDDLSAYYPILQKIIASKRRKMNPDGPPMLDPVSPVGSPSVHTPSPHSSPKNDEHQAVEDTNYRPVYTPFKEKNLFFLRE